MGGWQPFKRPMGPITDWTQSQLKGALNGFTVGTAGTAAGLAGSAVSNPNDPASLFQEMMRKAKKGPYVLTSPLGLNDQASTEQPTLRSVLG